MKVGAKAKVQGDPLLEWAGFHARLELNVSRKIQFRHETKRKPQLDALLDETMPGASKGACPQPARYKPKRAATH